MPQFKPRRRFVMARRRAAGLRSRARAGLILLSAGILLLLVIMALLTRFNPLIAQFAVSNSGDVITRIVNDSVTEVTAAENIGYDDLVTLKRDEAGNITALVTNMASINRLQAEISNTVIEKLNENDVETVRVPLGNLIGGVMFSGRGPKISAKVLSLSSVYTNFKNKFTAAGINQTQHQIMLDIDVELNVLLPSDTETVTVSNEIVIAETIIVGDVPGAYDEGTSD